MNFVPIPPAQPPIIPQTVSPRSVSPALSDPESSPSHDPEYYLHDDMAIFLVDHRLYKVHRHFLERESEIFRWMFLCPPRPEGAEGRADDKPIPLPGVMRHEFKALMDYFYNGMHDDFKFSLDEWISILSISSRYDMDTIRQRAIRQIISHRPRIDPVVKIALAEKHNIPDWLASAYASLCQRANPLEEWEAERLGMRVAVKLARAREAVREFSSRPPSPRENVWPEPTPAEPTFPDYEPYDASHVMRIVNEVFWPRSLTPELAA